MLTTEHVTHDLVYAQARASEHLAFLGHVTSPDALTTTARRLLVAAKDIVTYTVLLHRAHGMSWAQIAEKMGEPDRDVFRAIYLPIEVQYAAGHGIGPDVRQGQSGT